MFLYFYLLERFFFHEVMGPALARSYRARSFTPCLDLCRFLVHGNAGIPKDALLHAILTGIPFDRIFWHGLVGECLVHGALDIPRLNTAPESLCCLLAPACQGELEGPRTHFAPIQQVHFGTRDLRFGTGYYRPDHAGFNDGDDVARLAKYLENVDAFTWSPGDLVALADFPDQEQRAEELAYVRDWFPSLVELYQNARAQDLVVVCERS